jgi:NADPH:quinone reductase-like Zn-dependent oxidoreductase
MAASPINPSDLGFIKGSYGYQKPFPIVPGFEGSGTVVAAGRGLLPHLWIGRRVACAVSATAGTWAQYLVTRAMHCIPLSKHLSLEQGAMMVVNPMSALAFFDMVKDGKHAAIVNTAAASALGRIIVRLGRRHHVPVINIVRRQQQVDLLRSLGAEFVLQSNDANFGLDFQELTQQLRVTFILDAVGGELGRQLLENAPAGSTLLRYANLSGEEFLTDPHRLRTEGKQVRGFFLGDWVAGRDILHALKDIRRVHTLGMTDLQSTIQERLPLHMVQQAIDLYQKNMTAGKVLLVADPGKVHVDG